MISLTDHDGRVRLINPTGILSVTEAGVSSRWHGIAAFVKLLDGTTIEARETVDQIAAALEQDNG